MNISLMRNLSRLQRDVGRQDGRWEVAGQLNSYVTKPTADSLGRLSEHMDKCASEFQTAYPKETDLIDQLNKGARELSRLQGKVGSMAANTRRYTKSWGATLDDEIKVIGAAIDVMLGIK